MTSEFTIGQIAEKAQVNVQTVRYYERLGILRPTLRKQSGYRVYDQESLKRLLFIRRAQELGFALEEIGELLDLRIKSKAARTQVRHKAQIKLEEVQAKIRDLQELETTLSKLIHDCQRGRMTGACPILEKMEGRK